MKSFCYSLLFISHSHYRPGLYAIHIPYLESGAAGVTMNDYFNTPTVTSIRTILLTERDFIINGESYS